MWQHQLTLRNMLFVVDLVGDVLDGVRIWDETVLKKIPQKIPLNILWLGPIRPQSCQLDHIL